jgi:predicted nucleic acid-binding protein
MSLYMIDTQVLQYIAIGAAGSADPKASGVMDWYLEVTDQKHVIGLSTLVIGEFLAPHPPSIYNHLLSVLQENWLIYAYNDAAARQFAELRYEHVKTYDRRLLNEIREQQKNGQITRQGLSVDMMILAHAISVGAEAFFSLNDKDFSKLAINQIDVRQPIPKQRRLVAE